MRKLIPCCCLLSKILNDGNPNNRGLSVSSVKISLLSSKESEREKAKRNQLNGWINIKIYAMSIFFFRLVSCTAASCWRMAYISWTWVSMTTLTVIYKNTSHWTTTVNVRILTNFCEAMAQPVYYCIIVIIYYCISWCVHSPVKRPLIWRVANSNIASVKMQIKIWVLILYFLKTRLAPTMANGKNYSFTIFTLFCIKIKLFWRLNCQCTTE